MPGSQADFVAFTRGQDTIFFETDRYNIDNEDVAALTNQAQWLMRCVKCWLICMVFI